MSTWRGGRVDPAEVRGGAEGLEVVPLLEGLEKAVEADKKVVKYLDEKYEPRIAIAIDADVPAQTLYRVLYTSGQAGFRRFEFWGRSGDGEFGAIRNSPIPFHAKPLKPGMVADGWERCVHPNVMVGAAEVTVMLEAERWGRRRRRSLRRRRHENPPSWDGRALVGPDGVCPTVRGAGRVDVAGLREAFDRIEFAPLCRWGRVTGAEGGVGVGRLLQAVAALEARREMEAVITVTKESPWRYASRRPCESTTDGRLDGGWTARELQWLYSQKRRQFQSLLAHLEREAPLEDAKAAELARELEAWPVERRVVPAGWVEPAIKVPPTRSTLSNHWIIAGTPYEEAWSSPAIACRSASVISTSSPKSSGRGYSCFIVPWMKFSVTKR